MISPKHFFLGCSFTLALMGAVRPVGAVTTGETDTDDPPPVGTITIVKPLDGDVFWLSPGETTALVQVTIEWTDLPAHEISLIVDGETVPTMCADLPPCMVDVPLGVGEHTLVSTGISDPAMSNEVTIQIAEQGEEPQLEIHISEPADGAVFVGSPDAVVPVTIDGTNVQDIEVFVDDVSVGVACEFTPCQTEVTLPPGEHKLVAQGSGQQLEEWMTIPSAPVNVEVTVDEEATDGSATEGDSESPTEGSASDGPATDGTDTDSSGGDSASGGEQDGDKGCGCNAGPSGLDVLGLTAVVLLGPWARRRRR